SFQRVSPLAEDLASCSGQDILPKFRGDEVGEVADICGGNHDIGRAKRHGLSGRLHQVIPLSSGGKRRRFEVREASRLRKNSSSSSAPPVGVSSSIHWCSRASAAAGLSSSGGKRSPSTRKATASLGCPRRLAPWRK